MTTKEIILELFETNRGIYFSGESIAHRLSISRTSVWKAVKVLQSEGYPIDAVTNKGYVSKYRDRSFVIGKQISVLSASSSRTALALGVDDECHLQVKYEDGKEEYLSSGEISIQI